MSSKTLGYTTSLAFCAVALFLNACSFEYPTASSENAGAPDIVMNNLEYTRVRKGTPQAKFKAGLGERYNKLGLMKLQDVEFEQFNNVTGEPDASGAAGIADVELQSGNLKMSGGVNVRIESEDMRLETESLEWDDAAKTMKGGADAQVLITRGDGTEFHGTALVVNTRNRHWEFTKGGEGVYNHEEDEEEPSETVVFDDGWMTVDETGETGETEISETE